jgi:arylsulfatase
MLHPPRPRQLLGSLLLLIPACGGGQISVEDGPLPQRVLLISLDTLRADHTGFGGYARPTTPFLDSLAERGVVFDNHFANSNCTLPSHATMLTGLHLLSHGVRPSDPGSDQIHSLPSSVQTLAERFKDAGYYTIGMTSHGAWLNAEFGFDQGFDHFVSRWCDADQTIEDYLSLLDRVNPQNSFSFLHFFDVHSESGSRGPCLPYQSSKELVEEFAGEKPEDFTGCSSHEGREDKCASSYLRDISMKIEPLPDDHLDYLIGLYDAGIRKLDNQLRDFFAELDRRGILENTLVIITSDHGEAFFEHGLMLHDGHEDEVARVPLLFLLPESSNVPPHRLSALTQSTDLAPTILDLMGLDPIGQTASLAPAIMLGEEPADGLVLFQVNFLIGRDEISEYKFIKTGKTPKFYDRDADPEERVDLLADPEYANIHRQRLKVIYEDMEELSQECRSLNRTLTSLATNGGGTLSPERIAELKALGYLGGEDPPGTNEEP